jgi:membrane-bound lytic murein transglycosylase B
MHDLTDADFQDWRDGFRPVALRSGISASTFAVALGAAHPHDAVIENDQSQAESSLAIWQYLDRAVSESRVEDGIAALRFHRELLCEIADEFGVPPEIIVAIWGIETNFGQTRGEFPVVQTLATLCAQGRRRALFEAQLLAALHIVQNGDMRLADMVGSWAGAMGHTQFMPTSFRDFAVDWNRDGRRDVCENDPGDALASTANFLRHHGWRKCTPWFSEVALPNEFDFELADAANLTTVSDWVSYGVAFCDAKTPPLSEPATLTLPTGIKGPAFLMFKNAAALWCYNNSDAYVLAVGLLAQRIKGAPKLMAEWPGHVAPLSMDEMRQLQALLTRYGHDTFGADGLTGPNTFKAVKSYQRANALPPDGYASRALFELLLT